MEYHITHLPNELIVKILQALTMFDLPPLLLVSKKFVDISLSDSLWCFIFQSFRVSDCLLEKDDIELTWYEYTKLFFIEAETKLSLVPVNYAVPEWIGYPISNLMDVSRVCYCTKRGVGPPVDILFGKDDEKRFLVESVSIVSPKSGYTCPVDICLVFVFDEMPELETLRNFDSMVDPEDYDVEVIDEDEGYKTFESAGNGYHYCGIFGVKKKRCDFVFEKPIFGRYILLKILSTYGTNENIDINFFGVNAILNRTPYV